MADARQAAPAGDFRVVEIANHLLRHVRGIITITLGLMVLVGVLTIVRGADFVAQSRFNPQNPKGASQLSGLAAQLGMAVPAGGGGESVDFYAELARSPDLLRQVAQTEFRFPVDAAGRDSMSGTYADLLEIEGDTPAERLRDATELLTEQVTAEPDVKAGLVVVRTVAPWPALAARINRRVLELVNEFNMKRRRSSAVAEREFVEGRRREAQEDLDRAERAVREFNDRNRQWQGSPQLVFENARLQRQLDLASQVFLSIAQSYEQARIEEVRNTPVITVLDGPENLVRRAGGNIVFNVLAAGVVGFIIACAWAFMMEYLARERSEAPGSFDEFRAHLQRLHLRRRTP